MVPLGAARFSAGAVGDVGDVGDVTDGADGDVLGVSAGFDVWATAAEPAKRAAIATAGRSLLMNVSPALLRKHEGEDTASRKPLNAGGGVAFPEKINPSHRRRCSGRSWS
jgi:hypothetical protein